MATEQKNTGRDSDKFMLRFPDGMRDSIAQAAKVNNRSMNAEIVARLQSSFSGAIESQALADSKHLVFNADEIADKVVERLSKKEVPLQNRVIIARPGGMIEPFEPSDLMTLFERVAAALKANSPPEHEVLTQQVNPNPTQKGPQRSQNARKPRPK